jgi:hypothetical protein
VGGVLTLRDVGRRSDRRCGSGAGGNRGSGPGRASLNGGQGTVTGTLIGVLILKVLENGVDHLAVAVEVKYILIGVVIIANTTLSRWQRRDRLA